ncbi:MAG: NADH-quinone oxidoreductase subunit C [Acidimicrobiaceae bacterium]|nr:NADH-quinone oxidoreductase subunit C [Acidimicrobiaceae bacterium]
MIRLSSNDAVAAAAFGADETDAEAANGSATDEVREAMLSELQEELGEAVVGSHIAAGVDLTVRVTSEAWAATAEFLKREMGFAYFNFLSAIDWLPSPFGRDMDSQVDLALDPDAEPVEPEAMEQGLAGGDARFQVLARVNDIAGHRAVTLKADVDDAAMSVPSWVPVYAGANWHERETWEMFGIDFVGHPGLRHIYLPGAFEGNPLRKDYPLLARRVKPWPGIVDVELMPTDETDAEVPETPATDTAVPAASDAAASVESVANASGAASAAPGESAATAPVESTDA